MIKVKQLTKCLTLRRCSTNNKLQLGHPQFIAPYLLWISGSSSQATSTGHRTFFSFGIQKLPSACLSWSLETKPREMQAFSLPCLTPTVQILRYYLKSILGYFLGDTSGPLPTYTGLGVRVHFGGPTISIYNLQSKLKKCLIFSVGRIIAPIIPGTCEYATLYDQGTLQM